MAADCVLYAEMRDDGDTFYIADNYVRGDIPKITGQFTASHFGMAKDILSSGQTIICTDVNQSKDLSQPGRETILSLGYASYVVVPIVKKDGGFLT